MTVLHIYCGTCGGRWEVLERDDFNDMKYATCPHCGKQIDDHIWNEYALPAFGILIDANCELVKDAIDKDECGFCVSIKSTIARDPELKRMRTLNRRRY